MLLAYLPLYYWRKRGDKDKPEADGSAATTPVTTAGGASP